MKVVVAGAGVAGLEALVALRALAGEAVELELVAPDETFTFRALEVFEPFGVGQPRRYAIAELTRDLDATHRRETVVRVDAEGHEAALGGGGRVAYDALLLAVGGARHPAFEHGTSVADGQPLRELLDDVLGGLVDDLAVIVPEGAGWSLPGYEVALMTAAYGATRFGDPPRVTLVTHEHEPLESFGPSAAAMVRDELAAARVELVTAARPRVFTDTFVELQPGRRRSFHRVVHLPVPSGPRLAGVRCDTAGFIEVDERFRVPQAPDVFAVGDGTSGALKQGGLAAQQADAAAREIVRPLVPEIRPEPYRPVLRALLRTRRGPRYLRAEPPGGLGDCEVSAHALWWPPSKVASRWLTPWLATRDLNGRAVGEPPHPHGVRMR
jgi:sulfide:quinone oxidoreductase